MMCSYKLTFLFLEAFLLLYTAVEAQWQLGCFHEDLADSKLWHKPTYEKLQLTPCSCVVACANLNYTYAALQNGTLCFCGNEYGKQGQENDGECTVRCIGNSNIFCGGLNSSYIYSVGVPKISSVTVASNVQPVKTNQTTEITARAEASLSEMLHPSNITCGNQTASGIVFKWSLDGKFFNSSTSVWKGNVSTVSVVHQFSSPGSYNFCVNARNEFSMSSTNCLRIKALAPVHGLQVVPAFNDSQTSNMSLVPIGQIVFIKFLLTGGSNVSFKFDFGDGSSLLEVSGDGEYNPSNYWCARAGHEYKKCGNYTVRITAFNAVSQSSLTLPGRFVADLNISDINRQDVLLNILTHKWHLEFGNHTDVQNFTVQVSKFYVPGCNMEYIWNFGDDTKEIRTTDTKAQHRFNVNYTGKYKVTVKASNKLMSRTLKSRSLYVHHKLKGISFQWRRCGESMDSYCIEFEATKVDPSNETSLMLKYQWKVGDEKIPSGIQPVLKKFFSKVGRFCTSVTADNEISHVTSKCEVVIVQGKVKELSMADIPDTKHGQFTNFSATAKGTNVTFSWDFGDGKYEANNTEGNTSHKYDSVGTYNVTVTAENFVNKMIAKVVAVVAKCGNVKVFGIGVSKFTRSQKIYLEADVNVMCKEIRKIRYEWTVCGKRRFSGVNLQERVLIIPPRHGLSKTCDIDLKVELNDSDGNVLATLKHRETLTILNSALVAIIAGGTERKFSYSTKTNITLDASESYDPDNPEQSDELKFLWSCKIPMNLTLSCFKKGKTPSMRMNKLTFPADLLNNLIDIRYNFEFSLTLMKDGRENVSRLQLLNRRHDEPHRLLVTCLQCIHSTVSPSEALVVTGKCSTCVKATGIMYRWTLYRYRKYYNGSCTELGGSIRDCFERRPIPTPVPHTTLGTTTEKYTTDSSCEQVSSTISTGGQTGGKSTVKPKTTVRTTRGGTTRGKPIVKPTRGKPTVKPTSRRGGEIGSGPKCLHDPEFPAVNISKKTCRNSGFHGGGFKKKDGSSEKNSSNTPTAGTDQAHLGCVWEPTPTPSKHDVISWIVMNEPKTNTGVDGPNVVILDSLDHGRRYKLELEVTHGGVRKGGASVQFNVQHKGCCEKFRLTPNRGTELKTDFQFFCPKCPPATFDVRYKSNEGVWQHVYSGYRPSALFVLPAGLAKDDYDVTLEVTAQDQRGMIVASCPFTISAKPMNVSEGTSMDEILYNLSKSTLDDIRRVSDHQALLQYITAIATTLNRLDPARSTTTREETRTILLKKIKHVPVLDELWQVNARPLGLALWTVTNATSQLAAQHLKIALEILEKLVTKSSTNSSVVADLVDDSRSWRRGDAREDVADIVVGISSNLIDRVYSLPESQSLNLGDSKREFVFQTVREAESIIEAKLVSRVVGEEPLKTWRPYFSVFADKVLLVSGAVLKARDVELRLPRNLEDHLGVEARDRLGRLLTVHEINPHPPHNYSQLRQTKVASFKLIRYTGTYRRTAEDVSQKLDQEIKISFPLTAHKDFDMTRNVSLLWHHLNVHKLNRTGKNQSLQVTVKLLVPLPPGFVCKLLLRVGGPPTKTQYDLSESCSNSETKLLLSPHRLQNESQEIHIGLLLVDVYYRITKITHVPAVHYSLDTRWVGCYHYDEKNKDWVDDHCYMEKLTNSTIHCRCSRLAAFSGGVLPNVDTLSVHDLTSINRLDEFPILLALVCTILFVYLILLVVCVREDNRENRKHGALFINDNPLATHSQRYQIMIETGHWFNAGTTASVNINLFGEGVSSGPIELEGEPEQRLFQRTSRDVFIASIPKNLMTVWKVHIWHNNEGNDPSWFLKRVIVKDLSSQRKWCFEAHRWLAVDRGDGSVDCQLLSRDVNHDGNGANITTKVGQTLLDYHLWLSVAGRPLYSRFTRAQRLSCCLSLLLSFLCFNLIWYEPDVEDSPVLGALDISWRTVWVGFLSSLMALPLNLLWILMFRYSKRGVKTSTEPEKGANTIVNSVSGKGAKGAFMLEKSANTLRYLKGLKRAKSSSDLSCSSYSESSAYDSIQSIDSDFPSDSSSLGYQSGSAGHTSPVRIRSVIRDQEIHRRRTRRRVSLSHCFVYFAWIGSLLTSASAAFLTVWFGLSFGEDLSLRWLQSFCFAVVESLFISQPALAILLSLFVLISPRKRVHPAGAVTEPAEEEEDEGCEDMMSDGQGSVTNLRFMQHSKDELEAALEVRKRKRYLRYLKPPSKNKLTDARKNRLQRKACMDYLTEFVVLCVFLLVTCFLVARINSPHAIQLNQSLKESLLRSKVEAKTPYDWWKSHSSVLVDTLYREVSTGAHASLNVTPVTTFILGSQSLLVGNPKISQHRATRGRSGVSLCCWSNMTWLQMSLRKTRSEVVRQLNNMSADLWISPCTKELKVEVTVFTKAVGVLSTVALSVQASLVGKPIIDVQVNTFQAIQGSSIYASVLVACKVLFVLCYFYFVQRAFFLVLEMSSKYFQCFWRQVEFFILVLSSMCLLYYIRWSVRLYLLIKDIQREKLNMVYDVSNQAYWDQEMLRILYASIIFMTIIRSLRLLRVFHLMAEFGRLFFATSRTFCGCLAVFLLYLMSFAHPGYLLFGRLSAAFRSFEGTFYLACNFFRLKGVAHFQDPIFDKPPFLCCAYIILFVLGFVIILRGMSAAVLLHYTSQVKWSRRQASLAHDVVECAWKWLNSFKNLRMKKRYKKRRTQEVDDVIPVEYAMDEMENQIEEMLDRMDKLAEGPVEVSRSSFDSYSESDGEIEYLYRGEPEHYNSFAVSGYESDQSGLTGGYETVARESESSSPEMIESARHTAAEMDRGQADPEEGEVENSGSADKNDEHARYGLSNSFQAHTLRQPMQAKHMYGLKRKDKFRGDRMFDSTERMGSASSEQSDVFPVPHVPISKKHGLHHKFPIFNRNRAISPGVSPFMPQPLSRASQAVNSGTSSRPLNELSSFRRAGTGSGLSTSSQGTSRQAWGSLPSALERGMPASALQAFRPVTTPLPNLAMNANKSGSFVTDVNE